MKIPKLFKKAAAFVMAAVTALSIMPATAFAAGDIGTISFFQTSIHSHCCQSLKSCNQKGRRCCLSM